MSAPPPPSRPPVTWRRPPAELVPPKPGYHPGKSDGALIAWSGLCAALCLLMVIGGSNIIAAWVVTFLIWVVPAFWLLIIYLVARTGRRRCTVCGDHVPTGLTQCRSCGFDFAAAARR